MDERTRTRHVAWTGWDDDPHRLEAATFTLHPNRLDAHGTSRATGYATAWALTTGPGWVTERLEVTARGPGWARHLDLTRSPDGAWLADVATSGRAPGHLGPPGLDDPSVLDGAVDCDLALCPATNTMPVLRLGLPGDAAPAGETSLVMAWVDLPSLRVLRSEQVYAPASPVDPATGHGTVRYTSATRDFTADLTVDADGIVVDYPQLARRLGTPVTPTGDDAASA
ncbi:putative glycolipid-binding domain-containing protein [Cellulosimicrobium marinum]|uniref:putative glycolipid-binding domain-containing protein n=1 Tax=Cellulosimicrobium marinum TaxID=1638992 RepID=UPI001E3BE259|nr:putative glycolipid-binding domain-containing protein [Cellulosimicrobium marinum]MCB7135534.1 putative glycolipid-binding domain-containing protein [Cellulosimicrobium marinum]